MRKVNRPPPKKVQRRQQARQPHPMDRHPTTQPQIPCLPSVPILPGMIPPPSKPSRAKEFIAWADKNVALMLKYPKSFLAVDIRNNFVAVAETDQKTFIEKYLALPPEQRTVLFSFHTSLYGL